MRRTYSKIRRWFSVAAVVMVVCLAPYMIIFGADNANASLGNLQSTTANQGIANAMSQCMNFAYDRMEELSAGSEYSQGDLFNSPEGYNPFASVGDMYINVGYSTGQAITGYLNSSIQCGVTDPMNPSASVIDKFAQSVGKTDYMDIVCNGESAGIMKQQYWDGSNWVDSVGQCRTTPAAGTQYRYVWNDERAANSYLNSLYSGDWYSVSDFTPEQNYYRYYDEYLATCVDPNDRTPVNINAPNIDHSKYGSTIYWYDNNGSLTQIHFKEKDNTESWGISGLSSGLGGAKSCGELAQLINNQHEAMDDFVLAEKEQAKKDSCVNSIPSDKLSSLKSEAQGIVTLDRHNPNTVPADVVKNANRVLRNEFWEKDGNGDIVCWIPDSLSAGNTTTTPPPVTTPNPDDSEPSIDGENNTSNNNSSSSNGDLSTCFGQASSLGWIICPVVQLLGSAVDSIYEGIENQFLYVNPELTSSSSSTRTGWSYFRNFANIAFAIALAVIIVSQISGFGITNYGIKKLLPTLIIVAVLVNISFFICQFAVDASNIVGYSLKDMLESLSIDVPTNYSFSSILSGIVSTLLTGDAVTIAGFAVVATWPAWILPLLLTLLATIISILFFYLLLGVRQAGIIILIVISPLAIICYALPNTKKLFTRWWQLFSSLLILFPICGALMGGGIFASSLLLHASGGTFFFYFVAVLLQVIPFFFIPSLLRSSMSALGNLGVKMSNFGSRIGKGINRGISSTDSYKDRLRRNEMRNAERTFRRIDSGRDLRSRLARGMRRIGATGQAEGLEAAAQRRRARAISKYDSSVMEDLKARVGQSPMTEGSDRYNARLRELEAGELDATAKSYISQYKSSGQADDEEVMGNEYTQALSDLMDSPEDRDVRARLLAAQRILAKSDTGRGRMQNALYASTANGGAGNEGHRLAHSMLSDESGAEIKAKNPGFHSYLIAAAAGRRPEGTFTAPTPGAEDQNYHSSFYDHNKISSLDGSRLAGADETGLDRMLYSARNHRSEWTQQDINDFNMASTDALTNQNINTQPKVGQKINDIRQSLGLARIDTSRRFDSGGNVNVRNRGRRRRNRR